MRIFISLTTRSEGTYDNTYHQSLRSIVWRGLNGSEYVDRHDSGEPAGFVMSNPFPPGDFAEGEEKYLFIASQNEELLAYVAEHLIENRDLRIGTMPFHVDHIDSIEPDVGEPGDSGVLETGTGVLVRIPHHQCETYDIEHPGGESAVFWRPEHTMEPFRKQINANLDRKHSLFAPDHLPGPTDRDHPLFQEYELIKTFALPVTVTEGQEMTYILSKWRLSYTVRDDHHRRHLNLALDCGIGERNSFGLGFLNQQDDSC